MKLGTGLSLAGLIVAILGAFMPVIGLMVGWVALAFATVGALAGDRGLTIAVVALSAVVFLFMTPSLWVEAAGVAVGPGADAGASPVLRMISLIMISAPIAGILLNSSGKFALGQRAS